MTRIIGIDCGLNGAIAVFDNGVLVAVHDMPTLTIDINKKSKRQVSPSFLVNVIKSINPNYAIVERPAARPGQGVTAMFGFGRSLGVVEGVLAGLSVPVTYVAPATWTKAIGKAAGKDASRQRAIELFPSMADSFKRAKDEGRAEAVLIGIWGIKNAN